MATATKELRDAIVTMANANGTIGGKVFHMKAPSSEPDTFIVFTITEFQNLAIDPTNATQDNATANRVHVVDAAVTFTIHARMNESNQDMGHTTIDTWADALEATFDGIQPSPSNWDAGFMEKISSPSRPVFTENQVRSTQFYTVTMTL
jgi:hypothetical protein